MSDEKWEREAVSKLTDDGFFARRTAGSADPDIYAVYYKHPIFIEVKSSRKKVRYLSDGKGHSELKQFMDYIDLCANRGVRGYYFFRYITHKHVPKWKVVRIPESPHLIELDKTKSGTVKLTYDDGITYDEWLKVVK